MWDVERVQNRLEMTWYHFLFKSVFWSLKYWFCVWIIDDDDLVALYNLSTRFYFRTDVWKYGSNVFGFENNDTVKIH